MEIPKKIRGFAFRRDDLVLIEKQLRELQDDEVLIKNTSISLNPVDWKVKKDNNIISGVDGVGIAIGSKDTRIKYLSRYAYHCDLRYDGSFADYTIVKAKALIPISDSINDNLAASMPCPGLSAYQAIQKVPNLFARDVLVNGAGGMLGKVLVSLLMLNGARVSIISSKMHHEEYNNNGVYKCYEYTDKISKKFYAIFDTTGKAESLLENLEYYGHIVAILGRVDRNTIPAFSICPSLHEIALGAIHSYGSDLDFSLLIANAMDLYKLSLEQKILLPKIKNINFDDIPKALKELKDGVKGVKFVANLNI